jgi:hypothetical protein
MAEYKGTIKFISETKEIALVEEYKLLEDLALTNSGIGTGDNTEKTFSGTLQPIVEEGSLTFKVAGTSKTIYDYSLETSTGLKIVTSTGMGTLLGDGYFYTSAGSYSPYKYTECSALFGSDSDSAGLINILNKVTGTVEVSLASAPTAGQAVTVSYQRSYASLFGSDRIRLIKGDFTTLAEGDVIFYDYTTSTTADEVTITSKRAGQA